MVRSHAVGLATTLSPKRVTRSRVPMARRESRGWHVEWTAWKAAYMSMGRVTGESVERKAWPRRA